MARTPETPGAAAASSSVVSSQAAPAATSQPVGGMKRRDFLRTTAAVGFGLGLGVWSERPARAARMANEKLNLGIIGTANRAHDNINGVAGENIVAVCDIDSNYLDACGQRFPDARKFADYRELIGQMGKELDAVVVSTADHHHYPASALAMQNGLHCYCEKPLTHTVEEARKLAKLAAEKKLATQMGTQIHAENNYRRVVEIIQAGGIGDVSEVHVLMGKAWGGGDLPENTEEPPANLSWDLWLGPAPVRPFAPGRYHPAEWRRWWAFGGGTLGDMACHVMDLPFWALNLRHPTTVEAEGPPVHEETCPLGLRVKYEFPARDKMPACSLTWHDGNMVPRRVAGENVPGFGILFVGSEGKMFADYGSYRFMPAEKFQDYQRPAESIPNSIGHYHEWIKACKEGTPTTCNFDYSGALTETVLLGNVAYRVGKKIEWDAENLTATNSPEATKLVSKEYREGWDF